MRIPPSLLRIAVVGSLVGLLVTAGLATFAGPPEGTLVPNVPRGSDFLSFWAGAVVLDEAPERLYDHTLLWQRMRDATSSTIRFQNLYPPTLYQAFRPLLSLEYATAARLHLIAGVLLLALGQWLLVLACPTLGVGRRLTWAAIAVSPVAYMNVLTGQLAGVWLVLVAGGVLLILRGKPVVGGLVLALLWTKISVAAAVAAALFLCGQWAALGAMAAWGILLLGGSLALDGTVPWHAWIDLMTGERMKNLFQVPQRQLTLSALVGWPLEETGIGPLAKRAGTAVGVGLAILLSARARRTPVTDARWPLRFGLVLSAMLLGLPHLVEYDGSLHGIGLLASAPLLARARRPRLGLGLLVACFATPVLHPAYAAVGVSVSALLLLGWLLWAASEDKEAAHADEHGEGHVVEGEVLGRVGAP